MPGLEIPVHADDHGPLGPDPSHYAGYHCLVRKFSQAIVVQSPAWVFHCTRFMHGFRLIDVEAGVATAGSSDIELGLTNETQSLDMLTGSIVIPSGDTFSDLTAPSPVKLTDDAVVDHGDMLWIHVLSTATDARGLEVVLVFV